MGTEPRGHGRLPRAAGAERARRPPPCPAQALPRRLRPAGPPSLHPPRPRAALLAGSTPEPRRAGQEDLGPLAQCQVPAAYLAPRFLYIYCVGLNKSRPAAPWLAPALPLQRLRARKAGREGGRPARAIDVPDAPGAAGCADRRRAARAWRRSRWRIPRPSPTSAPSPDAGYPAHPPRMPRP
jgi:hypothetical protein